MEIQNNDLFLDFWKSSSYGGFRQAFDTLPKWFVLNKDRSIPMQQMAEVVIPMLNVLRYGHYSKGNEEMIISADDLGVEAELNAIEIYNCLRERLPLQVGRMILADSCSHSDGGFTQTFIALIEGEEGSFIASLKGAEQATSTRCSVWLNNIRHIPLLIKNEQKDILGMNVLVSLLDIMDSPYYAIESKFSALKKTLIKNNFILDEDNYDEKILLQKKRLTTSIVESIFNLLNYNISQQLGEEWYDEHPWFYTHIVEACKKYGFHNDVAVEDTQKEDNKKIDLTSFSDKKEASSGCSKRKRKKRQLVFSHTEGCSECHPDKDIPYYDLENRATIDTINSMAINQEGVCHTEQLKVWKELETDKAKAMFDFFIENGYLVRRPDGGYNWFHTQALAVYFAEAANDFLGLKKKDRRKKEKCMWKPFENTFFFRDEVSGEWVKQIKRFSQVIQEQPTPEGSNEVDKLFDKLAEFN